MFRSLGTTELLIIAAVVLFLFGGKKIPELFKGLAEAVKEFKKASKDTDKEQKEKEV
jgi:sec-independent protein translocase protein TatA